MVQTWATSGCFNGLRAAVSVGASPFTFINPEATPVAAIVSLGTTTLIEFSRDGVTFDTIGLIAGQFRLNPGDRLRVTYTLLPTIVYYPL